MWQSVSVGVLFYVMSLSIGKAPLPLADGLVRHVEPGGQILLGQAQGPALAADEITQPLLVHGRSPRVQSTPAGGIWQPTSGREESSSPTGGCFCRNAMSCHQHGCFPPPKRVTHSPCEHTGPLFRANCTKVKFCLFF